MDATLQMVHSSAHTLCRNNYKSSICGRISDVLAKCSTAHSRLGNDLETVCKLYVRLSVRRVWSGESTLRLDCLKKNSKRMEIRLSGDTRQEKFEI